MKDKVLITNIQRFSLHDGPGIRTTVFCKGCSLRCPWCANPENLEAEPEQYVKDGKQGTYGQFITCDELYGEVMKDALFYRQQGRGTGLEALPGGVTWSGGEALLQADKLEPLFQKLRAAGIHQCVETCLFVPADKLAIAMEYLEFFYVDIKIMDKERCRSILHGELELYLTNVKTLFAAQKPVVFRVPVIGGYTDGEENVEAIVELIRKYRPLKVELIKEHNLGQGKYVSLGRTPLELHTVTDGFMESCREKILGSTDIPTEICRI